MIKFNDNNYDVDDTDDNDRKMMILQIIFFEKLLKMKNPTFCHSFIYMNTGSDMSYLLLI